MKFLEFLEKRFLKITIFGVVLLAVSMVGFWIGNIEKFYDFGFVPDGGTSPSYSPYDYFIQLAGILLYIGFVLLCPALVKLAFKLIKTREKRCRCLVIL